MQVVSLRVLRSSCEIIGILRVRRVLVLDLMNISTLKDPSWIVLSKVLDTYDTGGGGC